MKTRAKKVPASKSTETTTRPTSTVQALPQGVENSPQVFILPKATSPDARIVTINHPATKAPERYFVCPETGCYEFTRVVASRRTCKSWLLSPEEKEGLKSDDNEAIAEAYVLRSSDLMIATKMDPLFLLLPALSQDVQEEGPQIYLSSNDYFERLVERSDQLRQVVRDDESMRLERLFETRMVSICDAMKIGNEMLYRLSHARLLSELIKKATNMVANGLPESLEEKFVKQPLSAPVLSIRRQDIGEPSIAGEGMAVTKTETESASGSAEKDTSNTMASSVTSPAASLPLHNPLEASEALTHLLRIRTALNFMLTSYVPPTLRNILAAQLSEPSVSSFDFALLDDHLNRLDTHKKEVLALRTMGEDITKKRGVGDDDEAPKKANAKKRKTEEEARRKNASQGVKKLERVDRSGMKKLSSFFTTKTPTKS